MANTTSDATSQLTLTSQSSLADVISENYGEGFFSTLLCPPVLFLEIIRINGLRAQASRIDTALPHNLEADANEIVKRVLEFIPETWAKTHTPTTSGESGAELWLLLGRIYQSAVTLYAIASLRSLSVLGTYPHHEAVLSHHRENLVSCLHHALDAPEINMWMMWPLVIAGLETRGSETVRRFVRTELGKISKNIGSPLPLLASKALDSFWAKGGSGWDGCIEGGISFVA